MYFKIQVLKKNVHQKDSTTVSHAVDSENSQIFQHTMSPKPASINLNINTSKYDSTNVKHRANPQDY